MCELQSEWDAPHAYPDWTCLFLQARVTDLKSCIIVMRIFRDMCNRRPEWQPVKGWVSDVESWCWLEGFFFFFKLCIVIWIWINLINAAASGADLWKGHRHLQPAAGAWWSLAPRLGVYRLGDSPARSVMSPSERPLSSVCLALNHHTVSF